MHEVVRTESRLSLYGTNVVLSTLIIATPLSFTYASLLCVAFAWLTYSTSPAHAYLSANGLSPYQYHRNSKLVPPRHNRTTSNPIQAWKPQSYHTSQMGGASRDRSATNIVLPVRECTAPIQVRRPQTFQGLMRRLNSPARPTSKHSRLATTLCMAYRSKASRSCRRRRPRLITETRHWNQRDWLRERESTRHHQICLAIRPQNKPALRLTNLRRRNWRQARQNLSNMPHSAGNTGRGESPGQRGLGTHRWWCCRSSRRRPSRQKSSGQNTP